MLFHFTGSVPTEMGDPQMYTPLKTLLYQKNRRTLYSEACCSQKILQNEVNNIGPGHVLFTTYTVCKHRLT